MEAEAAASEAAVSMAAAVEAAVEAAADVAKKQLIPGCVQLRTITSGS